MAGDGVHGADWGSVAAAGPVSDGYVAYSSHGSADPGGPRISSLVGECPPRKERSGPEDRCRGLPEAAIPACPLTQSFHTLIAQRTGTVSRGDLSHGGGAFTQDTAQTLSAGT